MPKAKKTDTSKEEETQEDAEIVETEDTEVEDEPGQEGADDEGAEAEEAEGDDEEEAEGSDEEPELDLDKEIEREKGLKKPDHKAAKEAFKKREEKRKEREAGGEADDDVEDDEDRPVTRRDLAQVREDARREVLSERALEIAERLSPGKPKEAELVMLRWQNRSFPDGMPLSDQIEEVYAGVHRKKLIGQRNEALRALAGKKGVQKTAPGSHRDGPAGLKPKMKAADEKAILASGYVLDKGMYVKKLPNGDSLRYDPKTKKNVFVRKGSN